MGTRVYFTFSDSSVSLPVGYKFVVYFYIFETSGKKFILGRIIKENEAFTVPANSYLWYTGLENQAALNNLFFGLYNSNSGQVDSWNGGTVLLTNGQIASTLLFDPTRIDLSQLFPNFYN